MESKSDAALKSARQVVLGRNIVGRGGDLSRYRPQLKCREGCPDNHPHFVLRLSSSIPKRTGHNKEDHQHTTHLLLS